MLLVTSELVTNGLRHGEPPVLLTLDWRRDRMRLTVADQGSKTPRPRLAGPDSTGGRGLFLVSALAAAWKIEPHIGDRGGARPGTSVWAEFVV
jgi:anti-sigma regulatory factor (Ser/Thr protein kinase)